MDNGNYVLWWWQRGEFAEQRAEWQASASFEIPGADLLQDSSSEAALLTTPIGEPPVAYDVRSTYDARPVNSYDFNFTAQAIEVAGSTSFNFNVPQGYRAVVRKWQIILTVPTSSEGEGAFNTFAPNYNNAAVPNNNVVFASSGTGHRDIETFFLAEEQTQFGCTLNLGAPVTSGGVIVINVWGNLIPVTSVALPFTIANETKFNPEIGSHA